MPTLNWVGKDKVINHHHDVPFRLLKKEYSFSTSSQSASQPASHIITIQSLIALFMAII